MSKATLFSHRPDECCPNCSGELVIRSGAHGPFYGCSNYPECDYIRSLKNSADNHIIKVLEGQLCPQCNETLVLRQGKYGMFIGCSNYPACGYIAATDKNDPTQITCPKCKQGHLLQKQSRYGKTFFACNRYPTCQFAINTVPVAGVCAYCQYPLLMKKRTAQGDNMFCASKSCGKGVSNE